MQREYFVYIMASVRRTLYIGVTSDLERRVFEHKHGLTRGFTSKYHVGRLVHIEVFSDVRDAIARDATRLPVKRSSRAGHAPKRSC